jgi:hypothetical protein
MNNVSSVNMALLTDESRKLEKHISKYAENPAPYDLTFFPLLY